MTSIKTYICLFIVTFFFLQIGQTQSWKKEHHFWELRGGVGLLPTFAKDHTKSTISPLSLELRYRINRKFSLGLLAGQSISTSTQTHHTGVTQSFRHKFQTLAFRASINSQCWKKWQGYGGISLAFQHSTIESYKEKSTPFHFTPKRNNFLYSGFVGMSFSPDRQFSVFGELGFGLSIATVGIGYSW